jgi:hypothetical protein
MSEEQHQEAFFQWCEVKGRQNSEFLEFFHVANGGHRFAHTGAKMKRQGVKRGVPDVMLLIPKDRYHGLIIEFKAWPNKPTVHQKKWLKRFSDRGYLTALCYTWEDAAKVAERYLALPKFKSKKA